MVYIATEEQILHRAEVSANANTLHPTEEDFQNEEIRLREMLANAVSVCPECIGTDGQHYLSCSIWKW